MLLRLSSPPLSLLATLAMAIAVGAPGVAASQAVKGQPPEDAGPRLVSYRGLIPGVDDGARVREVLGEPVFESRWYSYKLYYPAIDRPELFDVVHLHGPRATDLLANIDAASVPEDLRTEMLIRGRLGTPEYGLEMSTWSLLDYSELGLRFALDSAGRTIGVAHFPHGYRRVPAGERRVMDLRDLRQGPQPPPPRPADLLGLEVGATEVVITPTGEGWLGHPYTVHDDLKARIAVFRRGDLAVALVGADLFGMSLPEIDVMRKRVAAFGVDHMVLAMSHNHAAPDTIGVYGHYPREYIAFLQQRIVDGVQAAYDRRRAVAELRSASRELPMDGIRVQDLFRNARNPGILDPQIAILQAVGDDGEVLTTLVSFACHVESLASGAREISADFPGVMADRVRDGGGGVTVFLNGAVGGMVSGDNRERTFDSSREMGRALGEIILELAKTAQPPARFELSIDVRPIEIPVTNQDFRPLYDLRRPLLRGRVRTEMMLIRLGEAELVTLPGELLPEVGFEILEQMKGFPRMLVGLANDQLGYLIPPYDFREGFYEESMSQGPAAAVVVRDTAIRMLRGQR